VRLFPIPLEHAAMLLDPGTSVFDRTAVPGYVLSEVEKHHACETLNLGRRGFSKARMNDVMLGRTTQLDGDREEQLFRCGLRTGKFICWTIAGLSSANEVFGCK
jgi:hypothetical protein